MATRSPIIVKALTSLTNNLLLGGSQPSRDLLRFLRCSVGVHYNTGDPQLPSGRKDEPPMFCFPKGPPDGPTNVV